MKFDKLIFFAQPFQSMDGTFDDGTHGFGRLINHRARNPNIRTVQIIAPDGRPKLVFSGLKYLLSLFSRSCPDASLFFGDKALCDIPAGEELCYDYGERDEEIPWLNE